MNKCSNCKHLEAINKGKVYAICTLTCKVFRLFKEDTRESVCKLWSEKIREIKDED